MKTVLSLPLVIAVAVFGVCFAQDPSQEEGKAKKVQGNESAQTEPENDKAIDRTRRQVKMLDDIYKGGIVLITQHYVDGDEDLPAGTAFKKLFEAAKAKGWHEVRLLDATGDPYDPENVAETDFEKQAVKALKNGKPFVEQVVIEKDQRYLLAATPIPVVMKKCTMCHSNYDMDKKGLVIGALSYRVPVDE